MLLKVLFIYTANLLMQLSNAQLRNRPRGLGLLQLPTGVTDERSGMFLPYLYIAGNKSGQKPQTIPDVSLGGQKSIFSGGSKLNPFNHALSAVYNEDLVDSWSAGYALQGTNIFGLNIKDNYDAYADLPYLRHDGQYQPFLNAFSVGGEYDLIKIREFAGQMDLPVPILNELFDISGRLMSKTQAPAAGGGVGIFQSQVDFPLLGSLPVERFPLSAKYLIFMADRHMQYGHSMPNVNQFEIPKHRVLQRLLRNKANPSLIG